jgi:N-acetylmuramic acid 6-phosphate etherase
MVRLGKVYANRMVDVAVTNSKLEDRALRILQDLGGIARDQGRELLAQSGGSVKLALLMAKRGCDADQARQQLQLHGGQLRPALEA